MEEEYTPLLTPELGRRLLATALALAGCLCLWALLAGLELAPAPWRPAEPAVVWAERVEPLQPTAPIVIPPGGEFRAEPPRIVNGDNSSLTIINNYHFEDNDTTICVGLCP